MEEEDELPEQESGSESADQPEPDCDAFVVQEGRNEPRFSGLRGFVMGSIPSTYTNKLPKNNWKARVHVQTGPENYKPTNKTVAHKTPIVVEQQVLRHHGWGNYTGVLLVREVGGTDYFYIDKRNFVATPYWTCGVNKASSRGWPFIAEVVSNAKGLDSDGDWVSVKKGTQVLCSSSSRTTHLGRKRGFVACETYRMWKLGYGGTSVEYNPEDLRVIY
ncbi:hypothetical protein G6O69_15805 [Pseudenhygromyxa sp. WMMC2535]|uniref:hypothetical protein n=1 Tax=Pseudenhygromyxa sp. WMMC2535 TaxID=2712867 RepID=UPI0015558C1C|nr:hypothetical protein [Pseudenhygromyxa sp. WMMC2535]NVB39308.1 hypothetical protein [Pseudenhygromyxa sp. WMMC2535]